MNAENEQVIHECAQGALSGSLAFPQIIQRLAQINIERYHADYSRQEITYYGTDEVLSRWPRLTLLMPSRPSSRQRPWKQLSVRASGTSTPTWNSFKRRQPLVA